MSEEIKPESPKKSMEEIQKEYNQLSARAGDLSFRMQVMQSQVMQMYEQMDRLNREVLVLNEAKQEVQVEEVKEVANG